MPSPRHTTLTIMDCITTFLCLMLVVPSKGLQYQDAIDFENLREFLDEDYCMDGILSVSENGEPIINAASFTSTQDIENPVKTQTNDVEKTPMSLVSELCQFNNIVQVYSLLEERGPAHKKQFLVALDLGSEHYEAEGSSLKKAQHEAARLALNSTKYLHPPQKPKVEKPAQVSAAVEQLARWAHNHNDALVSYTFNHINAGHSNEYHIGMYSKEANLHRVTLSVVGQEFHATGSTIEVAKENAARIALNKLRIADGYCMLSNTEQSILGALFTADDSNPISIVHEFASKTKMPISFDLAREEGPAHIKSFLFKCSVGDHFETYGEGSSKKEAKRNAAQQMVEKLKSEAKYQQIECGQGFQERKKTQKKRSKKLNKSNVNVYTEEEENYDDPISNNNNPVSKLNEIQQKKHEVLPTYTLIENNNNNKEFLIEVSIGDLTFTGSGKNKKTAKQNAAAGLLKKMGYSSSSTRNELPLEEKQNEFKANSVTKDKPVVPGLNLKSPDNFGLDKPETKKADDTINTKDTKFVSGNDEKQKSHKATDESEDKSNMDNKKKSVSTRDQLKKLSEQLGFKFQFSDFPKKGGGVLSLLTLTVNPPKLCEGVGENVEESQEKAALNALSSLYKTQIATVSHLLGDLKPDEETSTPESLEEHHQPPIFPDS